MPAHATFAFEPEAGANVLGANDQLEEFANSLVVLLESELAQAQPITSQLSLGVGGVAGDKALVVPGSDRIQLAVIGRVGREIELERRVSGVILGW